MFIMRSILLEYNTIPKSEEPPFMMSKRWLSYFVIVEYIFDSSLWNVEKLDVETLIQSLYVFKYHTLASCTDKLTGGKYSENCSVKKIPSDSNPSWLWNFSDLDVRSTIQVEDRSTTYLISHLVNCELRSANDCINLLRYPVIRMYFWFN